ncbi:MAG TPA: 1-(5-phosphoribosyl)-5-((5-phosphoribosylamino)methylideneamino)imidazole-4-carboxamide isomerase [Gammaproteobacteria bacterium]|jgi:DUF971 family protein|uniref:1-(5-phosphoribosyl)-5-[(5-phosphoribosylamino)methylideneamino] imidazole-4-carboxamide isomerase n=5 Tax=OM182 clade TaxID=745002 RepID=A0A0R2SBB6_9GAMM|nr:MAG: 1-(5-phosphoribosyl)-5-[(5-phosphoribosylamino)methylideneamino] imidazole-4-carboxamide isomerase [OM182 bacterium BACL3 MAG-120507-bin80]KRO84328.1 MAG: 1-(5-phosphoribosyl)-5-[(5-phosphoribosylamino)methylideneamino] imidazole-4-carboxamide isomerase [OM182 bacterium BACL3 MAG-120619-bin3]KRO85665.1 MAG: 1-(5-phosphoribosyl)-5-[(5-phosphoribosylamino)methylideneamino] imidazole-4-carboxamide isomerase [OM182 bacterium BACL3 MAG-120920-bin41]KRP30764.1 MAG: 1-(5-phosphoribosyl)-5-[(5-p
MTPQTIKLHKKSRLLELGYADGTRYQLEAELLRVYSPSAEVRGHGVGQEILQAGKRHVAITAIEPVGNYAIKPTFDDGHNSGIFSWETLFDLATNQAARWADYTARLSAAGASREPLPADTQVIKFIPS